MEHVKYPFVKTLISRDMPVMLEGEAGSGKTTIFMNVAKELGKKFFSITGTQQTSVANLLGFQSVTGEYIPTQLREAYEHGGLFLIDEYDGMNPNTILALNTIENGFLAFPDKVIHAHPDFILCATVNPSDKHSAFTGRAKQDAAALDRFLNVSIPRDPALEIKLTSKKSAAFADKMRMLLVDHGVATRTITMRDTMRFNKLQELSDEGVITENPLDSLVGADIELKDDLYAYAETVAAMDIPLSTTNNVTELLDLLNKKGA